MCILLPLIVSTLLIALLDKSGFERQNDVQNDVQNVAQKSMEQKM